MKRLVILLLIVLTQEVSSQEIYSLPGTIHPNDSILLVNYPVLTLPDTYKMPGAKNLPAYHNNADFQYFRPIFNQYGWSCGQASSIGYNFTYEVNRLNNTSAQSAENQFPPSFTFNFFNSGQYGEGVHYHYGLDAIRHNGNPTVLDYGGMGNNETQWITGYEKYYNGMHYRIDEVYTLHVGDETGLQTLKYWLYDHFTGSPYGGLANFYTDLGGYELLPPGTPEEGKKVITAFGPYNGHSMTFIGWNDSIRWDYNNDGEYTNDLDINGDGDVNMKDWEIGGVILANSWGIGWADSGFCYVMYNVLAREKPDGGIWNKQVNVFDIKTGYEPAITFKVKLKHDSRNKIRVSAGISSDTTVFWPEYLLEFPIFNYQGGPFYMQGNYIGEEYKIIEFGLDVTPLLSYIQPGEPARFFLQVHENDPANAHSGQIDDFSLMDYTNGIPQEIHYPQTFVPLIENGATSLSVVHTLAWDKVNIVTEELPAFTQGQAYSCQLGATGGTSPYQWSVKPGYAEQFSELSFPTIQAEPLNPNNSQSGWVTKPIEFLFPFYDQLFDSVTVHVDGFLMFDEIPYPLPYQVDDRLLFRNVQMIAPFLNKEIVIAGGVGNGIWYEGDDNHAAFRWKVSVPAPGDDFQLEFAVVLYPDGRITTFCEELENGAALSRITGISNGDGKNFQVSPRSNILPAETEQALSYLPLSYPLETEITDEGVLTANPQDDQKIYNVQICVTDDRNISSEKTFQLSSGLIYDYTIVSGQDGRIDAGETVSMSFILKNTGQTTLENVELSAIINDPYINILSGSSAAGSILPGGTVIVPDAVQFSVENVIPDNYWFNISLHITSNSGQWESIISLRGFAALLALGSPIILDEDNGRLDPGETADMVITLINSGQSGAHNVVGEISTPDSLISLNGSNQLSFGNLQPGEVKYDTINITASPDTPTGHTVIFSINLTGEPEIQLTQNVELLVGRFPVYISDLDPGMVSGPILHELLDELEILHYYDNSLPSEANTFQNLFVLLGRKFEQHILTETEAELMQAFLLEGGNIYLEGGLTWYDDPQTVVHPMFMVETNYVNWHQIDTVRGVDWTFTEPMKFEYQGDMIYYNYYLDPLDISFPFIRNNLDEHYFMVAYAGDNYKTIASTIDFGALTDALHPSTKKSLLSRMLEFFGTEVVITELNRKDLSEKNILSVYPNPAREMVHFEINLKEAEIGSLTLFDLHGRPVLSARNNFTFMQGIQQVGVSLVDFPPGVYFARLELENRIEQVRFIKIN